MAICDVCGEEFGTLSRLRLEHDPCPVEEEQRKHEEALERLKDERGLEIGDWCRVIGSGREVEIVDIERGDEEIPDVVWVPAGREDTPERRQTSPAHKLV